MATPLQDFAVRRSIAAPAISSSYREFPLASPALADVAACTWTGVAGWGRALSLFPDGCVDLVWDGAALTATGLAQAAFRARLKPGTVNLGIRLRPGLAGAMVGRPAHRLRGRTLRLRKAWPGLAADVEAALARSRSTQDQRRLLEAMLLERLGQAARPGDVVGVSVERLKAGGLVREVAAGLSLGERDLRRLFAEEVGLSPKTLQRIFRFRRLLARLGGLGARGAGLADLAVDLGYADQAHMTRDCRRIAAATPLALARRLAG